MMKENSYFENCGRMVETQLIPRGISDRKTLEAFRNVPREFFVPAAYRSEAYEDRPLPLLCGQTISQPYMVAIMTQVLTLPENEKALVLEIGTGSGYQAAILAYMGHAVVSIERLPELVGFAGRNLKRLDFCNDVKLFQGDGSSGWPQCAPYDAILVTAAAPEIPEPLIQQLKPGGRIAIPCGGRDMQTLRTVTKTGDGRIEAKEELLCRFVPLIGKYAFPESC